MRQHPGKHTREPLRQHLALFSSLLWLIITPFMQIPVDLWAQGIPGTYDSASNFRKYTKDFWGKGKSTQQKAGKWQSMNETGKDAGQIPREVWGGVGVRAMRRTSWTIDLRLVQRSNGWTVTKGGNPRGGRPKQPPRSSQGGAEPVPGCRLGDRTYPGTLASQRSSTWAWGKYSPLLPGTSSLPDVHQ